jgi:hypothetical protein
MIFKTVITIILGASFASSVFSAALVAKLEVDKINSR